MTLDTLSINMKESLNSDGHQFRQYQPSEQSPLILFSFLFKIDHLNTGRLDHSVAYIVEHPCLTSCFKTYHLNIRRVNYNVRYIVNRYCLSSCCKLSIRFKHLSGRI